MVRIGCAIHIFVPFVVLRNDFDFVRNWDTIRSNADWIVQLHSPSDKLIPVEEGRFVAEQLKSEYMELQRRGHFMGGELPEVLKVIREKCLT